MAKRSCLSPSRIWASWKRRSLLRKIFDILLLLFAAAGAAIIGAWGVYQLGLTNNKGSVDPNYRYLMSVSEMDDLKNKQMTPAQMQEQWMNQYANLASFSRFYPLNAQLIAHAAQV